MKAEISYHKSRLSLKLHAETELERYALDQLTVRGKDGRARLILASESQAVGVPEKKTFDFEAAPPAPDPVTKDDLREELHQINMIMISHEFGDDTTVLRCPACWFTIRQLARHADEMVCPHCLIHRGKNAPPWRIGPHPADKPVKP